MAYDLSGSTFLKMSQDDPNCFGATFFGSLIDHGTSAPLWVSKDGSLVTIVCPENQLFNCVWGKKKDKTT